MDPERREERGGDERERGAQGLVALDEVAGNPARLGTLHPDEIDLELFWQIHRSTLVNTKAISGISRDFRGRQLVSVKGSNEKLEVSRSYPHLFKGM